MLVALVALNSVIMLLLLLLDDMFSLPVRFDIVV